MPKRKISLEVGDSFTFQNQFGLHLHVIVAESSPNDSAIIMLVYISSQDVRYKDKTTEIQVGEHPFITLPSWVRYQNIIICNRAEVEKNIVDYFGKIEEKLLIRIQEGILKSSFVAKRNRELFFEWNTDKKYREIYIN